MKNGWHQKPHRRRRKNGMGTFAAGQGRAGRVVSGDYIKGYVPNKLGSKKEVYTSATIYYRGDSDQKKNGYDLIMLKSEGLEKPDVTFAEFKKYWKKLAVVTPMDLDADWSNEWGVLEHIYSHYQGDNWSPNGEARPLIRALGLKHTSMSTGDVVYIGGAYYMVADEGFDKMHW
jgi:hypothetical protein